MAYATDVVNQYTTVGGVTRTHDNNGNLSDDGTYLFGYDFQNRLVELKSKSTSLVIATYRYDALGRRIEKAVAGGATTRYILDGVQVVEEYDGANVWQARYVYEDGIDQPRCMDRADIADVNGNANTTEVLRFHYHQQALGCVTEMTQPTGAVVEWVVYDVYGLPTIRDISGTVITQSAVGNPYLYTGRELDPESGLFFYRARTYDPGAGRFLQRDPTGFADGLNLREYVNSGPSSNSDPHGLKSERTRHLEQVHAGYQRATDRAFKDLSRKVQRRDKRRGYANFWREAFAKHLEREPGSGVTPCRRWLAWNKEAKSLEKRLQRVYRPTFFEA